MNVSNSVFEPASGFNSRPTAAEPSKIDSAGLKVLTNDASPRDSLNRETKVDVNDTSSMAIDSPIIQSVKVQSPRQPESVISAAENIVTPSGRFDKVDLLTPASDNQPNVKPTDKGVKSAANAAYDAFY